jgi:hypothetical protein
MVEIKLENLKRIIMFLLICIPLRSLFAWWASWEEERQRQRPDLDRGSKESYVIIGLITLIISFGFLATSYMRYNGVEKFQQGFGGGKVYWSSLLHGILYLLFTVLWFVKVKDAYGVLVADIVIGMVYFIGNYSKFTFKNI